MFGNLYYDIGDEKHTEKLIRHAVEHLSKQIEEDPTLYIKALINKDRMDRVQADFRAALERENLARNSAAASGDKALTTNARRETAKTLYEQGDYPAWSSAFPAVLNEGGACTSKSSEDMMHDVHQLALLLG